MKDYWLRRLVIVSAPFCLLNACLAALLCPVWPSLAMSVANVSKRWAVWAGKILTVRNPT